MLVIVFATTLDKVKEHGKNRDFFREAAEKGLGFDWEFKPIWITIILTFLVVLFVMGICVIINTGKFTINKKPKCSDANYCYFVTPTAEERDVTRENKEIKFWSKFIIPFIFLIGYFFPVALHLLRPGTANKIVGFVLISIFVVLSIISFFFGLRLDAVDQDWESRDEISDFTKFVILVSVPLVSYGLFLMHTIIFYVCFISTTETAIVDEEKLKN